MVSVELFVIAESHVTLHTWPEHRYAARRCVHLRSNLSPRSTGAKASGGAAGRAGGDADF